MAAIGLIIATSLFIPVNQQRTISEGVDTYNAHRPLFGKHQITGEIELAGTLTGLAAIVVDFAHSGQLVDVEVELTDAAGQLLARGTIPARNMADDTFAWAEFSRPLSISGNRARVSLAAPQAPDAAHALGVRFDPATKQLAIQVQERVPLARYLGTVVLENSVRFTLLAVSLLVAAAIAAASLTQRVPTIAWLAIIALAAIGIRLWYLPEFKGVSGGDPYNYLAITKSIVSGENPFAGTKRLPGLPLLLAPSYLLGWDDQRTMRLIAITSAGAAVFLLGLLARQLGLPAVIQLAAPALLAVQKDFLWISFRPEPYTLYAALLLAALVLFFQLDKSWRQILFGVILGYAAMTRQEGFVLAAILGLASLFYWRKLFWQGYAFMWLPPLFMVMPFFVHNFQEYGNPFFTPYFEGERLNIVDSWQSFKDNLGGTWGIIGTMGRFESLDQIRHNLTERWIMAAVLGAAGWFFFLRRFPPIPAVGVAAVLLPSLVFGLMLFANFPLWKESAMLLIAGLLLAGAIPFVLATGWRGSLVVIVLASQLLIATWFHPFPKHYQQSYPLLMLLLAVALLPAALERWPGMVRAFAPVALLWPVFLIWTSLASNLIPLIDKYNEATAHDSVLYRAIRSARRQPGPYGIEQAYLPATTYFGHQGFYYQDEGETDPAKEDAWLAHNGIRTLVVSNADQTFSLPSASWAMIDHFKSSGKNEFIYESFVYRVQP